MASSHFKSTISLQSIPEVEQTFEPSGAHGADIRFHGVVRGLENGRPIRGIDYACYPAMAEKTLREIGEALVAEGPPHRAQVHHRLGFVATGEASIIIRVQTPHSADGFELCREYLRRIKETVPIWKHPVFEE